MPNVSTKKPLRRVITLTGFLLCLLLAPILIINLSLIVQTAVRPEQLPSALGHKALILMPDGPENSRSVGIIRTVTWDRLKPHDMIAYRKGLTFFIESVHEIETVNGVPNVRTIAGSEAGAAITAVPVEQIEGVLVHRIPKLGSWALFLQSPVGLLLFMVLPVFLFLAQDAFLRNRRASRKSPVPDKIGRAHV